MQPDIIISITGVSSTEVQLETIKAATLDLSDTMEEIGQDLLSFFENDVFDTQGSALGASWAPLSENYALEKLRRYGDQPILVATGLMKNSYELYTAAQWLLIKNEAQNKKGDYYAIYHQEGTTKMPQRLLVDLPDDKMAEVQQKIISGIMAKVGVI